MNTPRPGEPWMRGTAVHGLVYVAGDDLTNEDAAHLAATEKACSLGPSRAYTALCDASDGSRRLYLVTLGEYVHPDRSTGCWPLVADDIAVVQAAFPGRAVYYTHTDAPTHEQTPAGALVDDAFLAHHLALWQQQPPEQKTTEWRSSCGHETVNLITEGLGMDYVIHDQPRPWWWHRTLEVECEQCGCWFWHNGTASDYERAGECRRITGTAARVVMTALLDGSCDSIPDALWLVESTELAPSPPARREEVS